MDIEAVLDRLCWVIDALPRQVPAGSPGQFFAVEQYLLHGPERDVFARRAVRILLKLSCYCELSLFYPRSERTLETPAPETLDQAVQDTLTGRGPEPELFVLLPGADTLLRLGTDDLCLTLYDPPEDLLWLLGQLARAEGLFLWQPPQ